MRIIRWFRTWVRRGSNPDVARKMLDAERKAYTDFAQYGGTNELDQFGHGPR